MTRLSQAIKDSISVKERILADTGLMDRIAKTVTVIVNSLQNGGKVHFCGNGGSAADAQHLATELSGRFYFDRPPLNGEALHCNTSFLTAVSNDYGFDSVYARLLNASGKKGDVLVAISTSGNSPNILNACAEAKEMGIVTIGMTGESGGKMKEEVDILLNIPSTDTPRIQEAHILVGHIICELVEKEMFG